MHYYEIYETTGIPKNHWFLAKIKDLEYWKFPGDPMYFKSFIDKGPFNIEVYVDGVEKDYINCCGTSIIIVSDKIKNILESNHIENIFFLPLNIPKKTKQKYYILIDNVRLDCINIDKSILKVYSENDVVPDNRKIGDCHSVIKLVLDEDKINGVDIFRPSKSRIALIISEKIKQLFEENNVTGYYLKQVTFDD